MALQRPGCCWTDKWLNILLPLLPHAPVLSSFISTLWVHLVCFRFLRAEDLQKLDRAFGGFNVLNLKKKKKIHKIACLSARLSMPISGLSFRWIRKTLELKWFWVGRGKSSHHSSSQGALFSPEKGRPGVVQGCRNDRGEGRIFDYFFISNQFL